MRWFGPRLKIQIGFVLVAGMCLMALFAPLLAPHDPYAQNLMLRLRPPVWEDRGSWAYPLGTDNFGRDLLSLICLAPVDRRRPDGDDGGAVVRHHPGPGRGLHGRPRRAGDHALRRRLPGNPRDPAGDRRGRGVRRRRHGAGPGAGLRRLGELHARRLQPDALPARAALCRGRAGLRRRQPIRDVAAYPAADVTGADGDRHAGSASSSCRRRRSASSAGLPPPTATWGNILAEGRDRLLVAPWIANLAGIAIVLLVLGVNLLGNGCAKRSIRGVWTGDK